MARFHSRARFRRASSPRRNREWIGFHTYIEPDIECISSLALLPGATFRAWIIDPTTMLDLWDEPTLVRSIVQWHIASIIPPATELTVAVGLITAKGTQLTPDTPDPLIDQSQDWIQVHRSHNFNPFTGNQGIMGADVQDIRAKRKLPTGTGLAIAMSNSICSPQTAWLAMWGRLLFLNN